jgi:hypothetical protein
VGRSTGAVAKGTAAGDRSPVAPIRVAKRFRLQPFIPSEDELHESVVALFEVGLPVDIPWTHFPAGGVKLEPHQAAKFARMGLRRGWPDFLIQYAARLHGLELKRRGGKPSKGHWQRTRRGALRWVEGQEDVFPRLEKQGALIAVCDSLEGVIAQLRTWQIPLRGGIR